MTDIISKSLEPLDEDTRWRMAFPRATATTTIYMQAGSDGWEELLWEGLHEIEMELEATPGLQFTITDIKSKYGTLRFYYTGGNEEIEDIVDAMERRSATTCEQCGALGRLRGKGWVYTACNDHTEERDK